jgi:hypothetical protein
MAGTAKRFSKVLHSEIDVHAAWLPITNTFRVGDYGLISDGVLVKMGNIAEFGVVANSAPGAAVDLDFKSAGTRVIKIVGEAAVEVLPDEELDAKLKIEFSRENSFLMKGKINADEMQNIAQTARALAAAPGWSKKFRVVSSTYTGQDCVIISTKDANSVVEIGGTASALKQFDLGRLDANMEFSSTKELGLQIVGKSGVVGLRMFKLRFGGGINVLAARGDELVIEDHGDVLEDDV